MTLELKPCPFCGGVIEMDALQGFREMASGKLGYAAAIYCLECSAQMSFCYSDAPDVPKEDIMALLGREWNTRKPDLPAALIEAEKALKVALEDLDEWVGRNDSLEMAGFNMADTAERADLVRDTTRKPPHRPRPDVTERPEIETPDPSPEPPERSREPNRETDPGGWRDWKDAQ